MEGWEVWMVNCKFFIIKAYYCFLFCRGYLVEDFIFKVLAFKLLKCLLGVVWKEVFQILFSEVIFLEGYEGKRDWLVLELLYVIGMCCLELIVLCLEDFNWVQQEIFICGKGGKERLVLIGKSLVLEVQDFFRWCEELFGVNK